MDLRDANSPPDSQQNKSDQNHQSGKISFEGRAQKLLYWLLEIGAAKISAALSSTSGFAQPWRHRGGDTAPLVTVCRGPGVFEQKMQTLLNSELFLLVGIFIPFSLFLDSGSSASNRAGDSTWGSGQVCCETKTN